MFMHNDWDAPGPRIRSSWNIVRMIMRGPLTDKRIEHYQQRGFYSAEYKAARRELMAKRAAKRDGNWVERDGRWIYSP